MNLIWSVKRVVRRRDNGKDIPIVKDPVYPDRYRPSGVGDNTKRKRRTVPTGSPPPFSQVGQFGRKKSKNKTRFYRSIMQDTNYVALSRVKGGRVSKTEKQHLPIRPKNEAQIDLDLIDLVSTDDDDKLTATSISAKRQKTGTALVNRHRKQDSQANVSVSDMLLATVPIDCNRENTTLELTTVLKEVRGILQQAKKSMAQCQLTMKSLFHCNSSRLGEDGIFPNMTSLSREIYRAHDGARDGITNIDTSVQWLEDEDRLAAK